MMAQGPLALARPQVPVGFPSWAPLEAGGPAGLSTFLSPALFLLWPPETRVRLWARRAPPRAALLQQAATPRRGPQAGCAASLSSRGPHGHPLAVQAGVVHLRGPFTCERRRQGTDPQVGCGMGDVAAPSPSSSLQVWLPAMKAKGLEISGTFTRQAGSISMDLQLTNKALQVMTDFAIQFNRNR